MSNIYKFTEVCLQFEGTDTEVRVYNADEVDEFIKAQDQTITDLQGTILRLEISMGLGSPGSKKH